MARILADNPQGAASAYVLTLQTDLFNRCFNFHDFSD